MSISYRTSNENYDIIIPLTQEQFLAMNQDLVPNQYLSYAPIRNHHIFSVLPHDASHDFYFSPNYDYDRNGIPEHEQIVIIHDGGEGGPDKYSTFVVNENDKTLTISYNN